MSVVNIEKLENILQAHWAEFFDVSKISHLLTTIVRNNIFNKLQQQQIPKIQNRFSATKIILLKETNLLEVWIEFSIQKDNGVVVGTLTGNVDFDGNFNVIESYGTHFLPEA